MDEETKKGLITVGVIVGGIATVGGLIWFFTSRGAGQTVSGYNLNLAASSTTGQVNTPIDFTATLSSTLQNATLNNIPVTLYDVTNPSSPVALSSGTTNSSGVASLTGTWANAGTYTVQAVATIS